MKKYILMTIFSFITALSYADDHEWTTYTGEVLQCNLKDGKSVEDVMDMVRTDWYELDYPIPYDGWVTTPTLFADNDGDMTYSGLDLLQIMPIWEPLLIGFLKMEPKYSVNGRI